MIIFFSRSLLKVTAMSSAVDVDQSGGLDINLINFVQVNFTIYKILFHKTRTLNYK